MNGNQDQVCYRCSYDANSATASHCQICGQSFRHLTVPFNKLFTSLGLRSLLLRCGLVVLLLLLSGQGYFLWMNQSKKNQVSLPRTASNTRRSFDIQLYDSMREVQNVPDGLFNYTSAQQFAALVSNGMNQAIAQAHPKFRLRFTEPVNNLPGSGSVIAMLINNQASFGQTARPIEDAEHSRARDHNFTLQEVPVGFDGVVFYTNRELAIDGLSVDQLQAIFMGKVTNWQEVGGPNLPIVPFSIDPKTTTSIRVLFAGLKNASIGRNVQIVRDYTEEARKVASTPGGISYGSIATVINQQTIRPLSLAKARSKKYVHPFTVTRQVNAQAIWDGTYPLTRRLFVVIRRDGLLDEQAGVAYANLLLSIEGQKLIEKAGFVALRL